LYRRRADIVKNPCKATKFLLKYKSFTTFNLLQIPRVIRGKGDEEGL
jgi:hypothetical protein